MHQLKRSTNERVLARHHALLKRLPAPDDANDIDFPDALDPAVPHAVVRTTTPAVAPKPAPHTVVTVLVTTPVAKAPASVPQIVSVPTTTMLPPVVQTLVSSSAPPLVPLTTSTPSPIVVSATSSLPTSVASPATAVPESSPGAATSKSSKGISSGAIGGIVAVLVVIALIAVAFLVRKIYQHRRAVKRNTWGAGLFPSLEKRQTIYDSGARSASPQGGVQAHERLANVPPTQMSQPLNVPPALATPSVAVPSSAYVGINAPAAAYNSGPASPISPIQSITPGVNTATPAPAGELAVVARTFIPSLPDELLISNAEQIRILSAYDDGWALCANARGEQGVVPLECLDRRSGAPKEMQLQPHSGIGDESSKTSRRMSSLSPAAPGTY